MKRLRTILRRETPQTIAPAGSSSGASTSSANTASMNDKMTTVDILQNTSTFLEILKSVGDAAQVLGPLKAVCGVLKIATDTAVLFVQNGEDLQELIDVLNHQQNFLENEIKRLSKSEYNQADNFEDLMEPLTTYILDLKSLHDKLATINARYNDKSKRKWMKTALMVQSDRDQIAGFTKKLENSFRHFMHSVTSFIARQTLLLRNEIVSIKQDMEEKNAMDLLNKLTYANARGHQHDICVEGTRVKILDEIRNWASDTTTRPIFIIMDRAGTGKSTIAATMAQEWEKEGVLLGRFFFSKPSVVTAKEVPSTLAKDIVKGTPSLRPHVIEALKEHDDFANCSIQGQLQWLVFTPLRSLDVPRVMVIDALDECSKEDRGHLLKSLLDFITSSSNNSNPLKVLITCRPEEDIESRIREPRNAICIHQCTTSLYSDQNQSNEEDIRLYAIRLLSNYLTSEQLERFIKRANGFFIWAAIVQKFVIEALDPSARFEAVMVSESVYSPLSALYNDILDASLTRVGEGGEDIVRQVLGVISVAREPLLVEVINEMLGLPKGIAGRVVMMLQSVLGGGSDGEPVRIMHPTFLEHIQESRSCRILLTREVGEPMIANRCLAILLSGLKYDICDIFRLEALLDYEVYGSQRMKEERKSLEEWVREKITPGLRYAAIHAISHIMNSLRSQDVIEKLRMFFKTRVLNWIELMSLLDKIVMLMQSIHHLKEQINETINKGQGIVTSDDAGWCEDILKMVQPFQSAIEKSARQVYFSALPFTPVTSRIAGCYLEEFSDKIPRVIRGIKTKNQQALMLGGPTDAVRYVVYSPDGHYIVFASGDRTIRVWDAVNGGAFYTLARYLDFWSFAMSPNGQHIASGLDSGTIRIWETATGAPIHILTEHTSIVSCLAFSPCGRHIASGSWDKTVRIWDTTTGSTLHVLTSHTDWISCLSFSPNGSYLASGSKDGYARIHDAVTGTTIHALQHVDTVWDLSFSPDGRYLAFQSGSIRVWDVASGVLIRTLGSQTQEMNHLLFSPDGKYIISVYTTDNTIQIWETATGSPSHTLTGHTEAIHCIALSPDGRLLASGSEDRTVRLWDTVTRVLLHIFTEPNGSVLCLSFSPDGQHLAAGSDRRKLYTWGLKAAGTPIIDTGDISGFVSSLDRRRSPLRSVNEMHGVINGGVTYKNVGHIDCVICVEISPDGRYLALGSSNGRVCIWDVATGEHLHTLNEHIGPISCLAFSPDGKYLASRSYNAVHIWDLATAMSICELLRHPNSILSMSFCSQQGTLLLSVHSDNESTIWNLSTSPPSVHSIQGLSIDSRRREPSLFYYWQCWTYTPRSSISFHLPSYFDCQSFCSREGILAYGGEDSEAIIIDCSHLIDSLHIRPLTPDDNSNQE